MRIVLQVGWLFITGFLLSSCSARQIPLTNKEVLLEKRIGLSIHGSAKIQYDYDAVSKRRNTGNFILLVTQNERGKLCSSDSIVLKEESAKLASSLLPAIRFRENHHRFTIIYSTVHTEGSFMEWLCTHTYSATINQGVSPFKAVHRLLQ